MILCQLYIIQNLNVLHNTNTEKIRMMKNDDYSLQFYYKEGDIIFKSKITSVFKYFIV